MTRKMGPVYESEYEEYLYTLEDHAVKWPDENVLEWLELVGGLKAIRNIHSRIIRNFKLIKLDCHQDFVDDLTARTLEILWDIDHAPFDLFGGNEICVLLWPRDDSQLIINIRSCENLYHDVDSVSDFYVLPSFDSEEDARYAYRRGLDVLSLREVITKKPSYATIGCYGFGYCSDPLDMLVFQTYP